MPDDQRPDDEGSQTTAHNAPETGDGEFPVSSSAGSLLQRLKLDAPEPTPRAPVRGTGPFTTVQVDEIDPGELDAAITESAAQDPESALRAIEEKMAEVTRELTEGRVNQAQFQSIYTHYAEQKTLILRLLSRDPETTAWQRAAKEGYTGILRRRHAARLEGLVLLDNWSGEALRVMGRVDVPREVVAPLLESLRKPDEDAPPLDRPLSTQIESGRWLSYYRGTFVTAIAVYSAEPSAVQLGQQAKSHAAFEAQNRELLEMGYADPETLSYPQQALFQEG